MDGVSEGDSKTGGCVRTDTGVTVISSVRCSLCPWDPVSGPDIGSGPMTLLSPEGPGLRSRNRQWTQDPSFRRDPFGSWVTPER